MKILAVSDEESPALWDYYQPSRLKDVDLILSCGDLKAEYLSFLVTMGHAPLLYVPGNHDQAYAAHPPEGCDCIDGKLVVINGLRILGLGGSLRYNGGPYQYTEQQMRWRIRRMWFQIQRAGGVDIVLTHAPVRGCGDEENITHRGFIAFLRLIERYSPRYLIHGHVHMRYGANPTRIHQVGETTVINACERYYLEL